MPVSRLLQWQDCPPGGGQPCIGFGLFRLGSTNRADVRAGTAIDAGSLFDYILRVAGRDAAHRAFRFAGTTVDAVVIDYVCHDFLPSTFYSYHDVD